MITMRAYEDEVIDVITVYEGTNRWRIEKYADDLYMVFKNGGIDSDYKNDERNKIVKIGIENMGKKDRIRIGLIRL